MELISKLLVFWCVIFSLTGFAVAADTSPVRWEDIRGWRNLGPNWVGGLNEQGEVVAIYDLAFPNSFGNISLGTLDSTSAGYGKVINLLKQAKKEASSSLKIQDLHAAKQMLQVDEAIRSLEKLELHAKGVESRDRNTLITTAAEVQWWKKVPWKSVALRESSQPPQSFSFSDIQMKDWVKGVNTLAGSAVQLENSVLRDLHFTRSPDGVYEFNISSGILSQEENQPIKIADLRCLRCGFDEQLARTTLREPIGKLLDQIPVPYLSGLVKSAMNEYFMFQDRLLYHHQEMVLEMVQSMSEAQSKGSDRYLTARERELTVSSILYARTSAADAQKWIDRKPMDEFNKQEMDAIGRAVDARKYLNTHDMPVSILNERFGLVIDSQNISKLFCLSAPRYFNILATFQSYDSSYPERIRNQRIAIETAHILVQFLNIFSPIPIVGTVVSKAFDWLLESRMHTLQEWEARLLAHLILRNDKGESWDNSIDMIGQQAINPMELSKSSREDLVLSRKKAFSIP